MSAEANKQVLQRFFDEVVNAGRLDVVPELVAPQMVERTREVATMWRTAFDDLHVRVDDMLAEGDRVAATVTISGTHSGVVRTSGFPELAPTGRHVTWTGMDWVRISDGRIVERRAPRDLLGLLEQLERPRGAGGG